MHATRSHRVLKIVSGLAVAAAALALAGCGGGDNAATARVKPAAQLTAEQQAAFKAMTEKAQADSARLKAEEDAKPKAKPKAAGKKGARR